MATPLAQMVGVRLAGAATETRVHPRLGAVHPRGARGARFVDRQLAICDDAIASTRSPRSLGNGRFMRVVVDVMGPLQRFIKDQQRRVEVEVEEGTTLLGLLIQLGIDTNEPWNASLNGTLGHSSNVLTEESSVIVFPPIAGG